MKNPFGTIPDGWRLLELQDVFNFQNGKAFYMSGYSDNGYKVIDLMNISSKGRFQELQNKQKYVSEEVYNQNPNFHLEKNDLIMAMSDMSKILWILGRTAIIPRDGEFILNQRVGRLTPKTKDIDIKYGHLITNSSYFLKQLHDQVKGTAQFYVNTGDIKESLLLIPPLPEQQKMAAILSSVDDVIEKTEAIIEQAEVIKKGLIQQLFIKGIGHTKFSKTEIGEIPEEWKLGTLKDYSEHITKGATPTTYGFDWVEEGVLFLRNECVKETGLSLKGSSFISEEAHVAMKRSIINLGDILITITGNLGQCCIYDKGPQEANINQHIARIRIIDKNVHPKFVCYFLNSDFMRKKYELIKTGLAYPQLSLKQIQDIVIPIPSIEEQQKIVNILSGLEKKIKVEQLSLTQLRNLKRGLMQSLLTGKVRVKVDETEVTQV
ncbi:restriction endonuclease subunit S [Bacillus mycoides]|uniref:restriction endonuclease subunit S n=1 Tax=Bacillus mycoides TaxID=1405 RepID=UPI002E1E19D0|nr:restriction endonuclease subunit S [Bacillus mycoides]MED1285735.1 restriction endonuclease subunit S [Bacillus mycoides]